MPERPRKGDSTAMPQPIDEVTAQTDWSPMDGYFVRLDAARDGKYLDYWLTAEQARSLGADLLSSADNTDAANAKAKESPESDIVVGDRGEYGTPKTG